MSSAASYGGVLDWGVAEAPMPGAVVSGDAYVVAPFDRGVLVGVVDGLGHGAEAALAAQQSVEVLRERASETLRDLVQACHEALRKTRGVVMTLVSFGTRDRAMSWMGVGNVDAVLVRHDRQRRRQALATRGGVVGYQLPPLRIESHPLSPGDLLVLATDGIRGDFADDLDMAADPDALAQSILKRHGKGSDDALVLVARYRGGEP